MSPCDAPKYQLPWQRGGGGRRTLRPWAQESASSPPGMISTQQRPQLNERGHAYHPRERTFILLNKRTHHTTATRRWGSSSKKASDSIEARDSKCNEHVSWMRSTTPTETMKVKTRERTSIKLHVFQQLWRFPRETPHRYSSRACAVAEIPRSRKGPRDFYLLRWGTWRRHREQSGLIW